MLLNINSKLRKIRQKFKLDKRGVTAVEYAIIAVAMSSIILLVFKQGSLQNTLTGAMTKISASMDSASESGGKASEGEKENGEG